MYEYNKINGGVILKTRVLKSGLCDITQYYNNSHQAIDLVREGYRLDYVVAHSDGKVVYVQDGYSNMKGSVGSIAYGNYIKIEHGNGYETLYAHLASGINIKNGSNVSKGQVLGYMSDSGNAYGKHLHFEVFKNGVKIDPYPYLDSNLFENVSYNRKIGDTVTINGVYVSSDSTNKLIPVVKSGKITRIESSTRNPYLLNNGQIGWVNDNVIIDNKKYLSNPIYKGTSLVDALNQINIDSSYSNREKLAIANNIDNYIGSSEQNIKMLNLLKNGKLISV